MKHLFAIILILLATVSCKELRTIPDDKLSLIVQDLALVNAYAQQENINTDSLDIYTPVFDKYGYTMADFRYTLTTFSKRKSMRVSDIINETTKLLESDFNRYNKAVAALDSVDARSRRLYAEPIKIDSTIKVRRISDTSHLRLSIPVKEGRYRITYRYTLDSSDTNYGMRSSFIVKDTGKINRTVNTQWLSPRNSKRIEVNVDATPVSRRLTLSLGGYGKNMQTPHLTIDSLKIVYLPPATEAVQRITDSLFKYKLRIDDATFPPKNSLTPPLYAPRADSTSSSKPR